MQQYCVLFPLLHLLFNDEPNHNDLLCALQRNQGHLLFPLLGAAFSGHEDPAVASPLPLLQQGQYLPFRTLFDLLPEHCPVHKKSSINICWTNDVPQTELSSQLLTQSPSYLTTFSSETS